MQVPVLWCDFDNGTMTMHERIEAVAKARGLPEDTPLYYVSMPTPWLDASKWPSVAQLVEQVRRLEAQLIIIDNLRDVSGGVEENSAEMGDVMSHFRRLAEDTGAAVMLIHHQRKTSGVRGRAGDTLRGHSSIEAALDLALLIEREEYAETIKVKATKVRGPDVLPFGAVFSYEHKPGTSELAEAKFFGLKVEDLTSDAAIRRVVLKTVEASPNITKGNLAKAAKELLSEVGINRIRAQIDWLTSEGELTVTSGKGTTKHYNLAKATEP